MLALYLLIKQFFMMVAYVLWPIGMLEERSFTEIVYREGQNMTLSLEIFLMACVSIMLVYSADNNEKSSLPLQLSYSFSEIFCASVDRPVAFADLILICNSNPSKSWTIILYFIQTYFLTVT